MRASDIPGKFPLPFAASATSTYTRAIPTTSADANAASLTLGFPPNVFVPISAGGSPPDGRDFNGILNEATAWNQWQQLGGQVGWDSVFSSAVGGYPKGAIVSAAVLGNFWLCSVDDNVSDPDTGGAGWFSFTVYPAGHGSRYQVWNAAGTYSFTVPDGVYSVRVMKVIGGGGGAGSVIGLTRYGGCGGGGGIAEAGYYTVTPTQIVSVIVGAGGLGQATTAGGNGQAGGVSSFGAFCSATGGGAGLGQGSSTLRGGISGVGTGGRVNSGLGDGSTGGTLDLTNANLLAPGIGGGPGGQSGTGSGNQGYAGRGPGGGGGGSASAETGSTGGNGADGLVFIEW